MPCSNLSTPGLQEVIGKNPAPERHKTLDRKMMNCSFFPAANTQGSSKLEKAEILQMTVDHLKMLHATGGTGKNRSCKCTGEVKVKTWKENSPSASAASNILVLVCLADTSQHQNECCPACFQREIFFEGGQMDVSCPVVFLMSNMWVSIPYIHLEGWGMWDSKSQRPTGTALLLLSHTLLKAASQRRA